MSKIAMAISEKKLSENKDENVHRFAVRGREREREREIEKREREI
jgi:hypothetical protein